jgi:hypothetical protein
MSVKYKIFDGDKVYFVPFTLVKRIKLKLLILWKALSIFIFCHGSGNA